MRHSRVFSWVSILMLLSFCSKPYKYESELKRYLDAEHSIDLNIFKNFTLLIVPLNGCGSCIESSLELIKTNYKKQNTVLCLSTSSALFLKKYGISAIDTSSASVMQFVDYNMNIMKYEIGSNTPMIFSVVDGKVEYFSEINDNFQPEIKDYFKWE